MRHIGTLMKTDYVVVRRCVCRFYEEQFLWGFSNYESVNSPIPLRCILPYITEPSALLLQGCRAGLCWNSDCWLCTELIAPSFQNLVCTSSRISVPILFIVCKIPFFHIFLGGVRPFYFLVGSNYTFICSLNSQLVDLNGLFERKKS